MTHLRLPWAAAVIALIVAGTLTSPGTTAHAAEEAPVVVEVGDTVTYNDPALAGEDTTSVEGTLRITAVDRVRGGDYQYAVETPDGETVPVEVATDLPISAANGAVEAEVVDGTEIAEATVEIPPQAQSGRQHRAYVVRVSRTGTIPAEPEVAARLQSAVLDEWDDEADSAIDGFTVAGITTLPASDPAAISKTKLCDLGASYDDLWTRGAQKFPGVSFGSGTGNHLVMVVSGPGCGSLSQGTLGIGSVGSSIGDGGMSTLLWDDAYVDATGVHELGHNVGLGHANVKECPTCSSSPYLDLFSVMGFGMFGADPPALDSQFRDQLGITQPGEIDTIGDSGGLLEKTVTRSLVPRGAATGLRGVEVVDAVSGQTFWIEYRGGGADDRDAGSAYAVGNGVTYSGLRFDAGVTVTRSGDDLGLDLLPLRSGSTQDASLAAGQVLAPSGSGVKVAVVSLGSTAEIAVTTKVAPARVATGAARVGAAAKVTTGGWPEGTTFAYVWSVNGASVSTDASYVPTPAQRGARLGVAVTADPPGDGATQTQSAAAVTIGYGLFATSTPKISGTPRAGRTLTAVKGTWRPAPTAYRWQVYSGRKWSNIAYATKPSYRIAAKYAGKKVRVRVSGAATGYTSINRYSSATSTIKR